MTMEMSCRQHRLSSYWLRCLLFIIALNARTAVSGGNAADHEHDDDSTRMMQFFQACQNGPLSSLQEILDQHPTWLQTHRTATGESCLHLASLTGYLPVMEWLLQSPPDSSSNPHRMDVNIRSMGDRSLRETPLSMAVKNANVKAAKLLLEAGADVNLDIDSMMGGIHPVTVLDVLVEILPLKIPENPKPILLPYLEMKQVLLDHGAMRYSDLETASEL